MNNETIHGPLVFRSQPYRKLLNSGTILFLFSKADTFSSLSVPRQLLKHKGRVLHQNKPRHAQGSDCSGSTLLQDDNAMMRAELERRDLFKGCRSNIDPPRWWRVHFISLMQIHFDTDTRQLYVTTDELAREEGVQ
jgi:hypothetical protein